MPATASLRPPPAVDAAVPGAALRAAFAAPLRPAAIAAACGGVVAVADIDVALETGSTNADLLHVARQQAPLRPQLRSALHQNAGRGRLGRRWHAAPGAALLFSAALPLGARIAPAFATLVAGVALAEALHAALAAQGVDPRLKWPNDLLLSQRKLGGVLAELAVDRAGQRTLVVGVGINLWLDPAAAGSIDQPAAALAEQVPLETLLSQREALLGACAGRLVTSLSEALADGFVPFQRRFMQRFALLNEPVQLIEHGARVAEGRALGVDGEGRLLVDRNGRITAFANGEVSLRPGEGART